MPPSRTADYHYREGFNELSFGLPPYTRSMSTLDQCLKARILCGLRSMTQLLLDEAFPGRRHNREAAVVSYIAYSHRSN